MFKSPIGIIDERPVIKKRITAMISIMLVYVLAINGLAAPAPAEYNVTINIAEVSTQIITSRIEPLEILEQANLILGANDMLETAAFTPGADSALTIYRAYGVQIIENGIPVNLTGCKDVRNTLKINAIELGADDFISTGLDEPVYEGMAIVIDRAFGVTVNADGNTISIQAIPGSTVRDAVTKAGIAMDADDETNPSLETALASGMTVSVLRVETVQRTVNETIKFEKTKKTIKDMYTGETSISQAGVDGEKTVVYGDKMVNGVLEKTSVVTETVTKAPVPQITLVGSKLKVQEIKYNSGLTPISDLALPGDIVLDANGMPVNYTRIIEGPSTAYYGGGTTATGRPAMEGHVAVNPKQIPYGTRLYVVSLDGRFLYGYCIAADTGGFVHNGSGTAIDIYFNTRAECVQFGRRGVRIYVLD